jgi:hypothetical protein
VHTVKENNWGVGLGAIFLALYFVTPASALTLEELRNDPKLTPARFARRFASFSYQFHAEVQDVGTFLNTKSGDCDDYATLAAEVLREKGYTTRLISVRMPDTVHVVCYVEETRSYLDYNLRGYLFRTVSIDGSLTEIARKVAKSFETRWVSVSEISYLGNLKRLIAGAARMESAPARVWQLAQASPRQIKIDF